MKQYSIVKLKYNKQFVYKFTFSLLIVYSQNDLFIPLSVKVKFFQ